MSALLPLIVDMIAAKGPLTIATYMELALQHPEFGYYSNGDRLGDKGDFVTAPEISQMFGEMLGLWCADVWRKMGKPASFTLLELGPGRGTLMQDALRATTKIGGFHDALHLMLLESNATFRKLQSEKLGAHLPIFLKTLSDLPDEPAIILANEFFDALPIRQFLKTFQGWSERLVMAKGHELFFTPWPLDDDLVKLIPENKRTMPPGTTYEISFSGLAVIKQLGQHLARYGGGMLTLDYGYSDAAGMPTLQALSDHTFVDVLDRPGEVDLTSHVDFSSLGAVARAQGVMTTPIVGQGEFLRSLGIEVRAAQLKQHATPNQIDAIDAALTRLTDAREMGTLFKALGFFSPLKNSGEITLVPADPTQSTVLPGF